MAAYHKLDRDCTKKLYYSNSTPASFYGLPKIHKPERPLRPITSSISSLTYAVCKHLVFTLSPFRKNGFSVKNNSEFVQKIQQHTPGQHTVARDEIMVSFDVKSLFTSIPVDLSLTIANEKLQKDQDLAERTNMSISNIMRSLEFVLTSYLLVVTSNTTPFITNKILDVQRAPQTVPLELTS